MFSPTYNLAIAELTLYIILTPLVLFTVYRHGKHGIDGWGFLIVYCILRLTSSGMMISDGDGAINKTAAIVNSVGISALLATVAGVLHEISRFDPLYRTKLFWFIVLQFHGIIAAGIGMAASGGSRMYDADADKSNAHFIQLMGYITLLTTTISLGVATGLLIFRLRRSIAKSTITTTTAPMATTDGNNNNNQTQESAAYDGRYKAPLTMAYFIVGAWPFILIRACYGMAFAAETDNYDLSPVVGTFAVKFCLIFGVQLVTAVILVTGGLITRDMNRGFNRQQEQQQRQQQRQQQQQHQGAAGQGRSADTVAVELSDEAKVG